MGKNTNNNTYPYVQLLDNENNPISPLVDIDSIYENVTTKASAHIINKVSFNDDVRIVLDSEMKFRKVERDSEGTESYGEEICVYVGAEVGDEHQLELTRFPLTDLLEIWFDRYNLTDHRLISSDDFLLVSSFEKDGVRFYEDALECLG